MILLQSVRKYPFLMVNYLLLVLEYLIPSSGKLYHHKIKMPQLKSDSDTMETIEAVKKKHHNYFAGNKVSESQIKSKKTVVFLSLTE